MSKPNLSTPYALIFSLFNNRELLWELVKRDFFGRYKGSMLGVAWSLFNPLLMLTIYTIVFSVAFKAKWGATEDSKLTFAIMLFSGMIVHNLFAECLNRSPSLIINHSNYVKKVVFPLEILSCTALLSAVFHFIVSFCVLLLFCFVAGLTVHIGVVFIPFILLPLFLMTLGLSWIFASLGVYLRDLSQIMGVITTVSLFLAPVFYPIEVLPPVYQSFLMWNPISLPVIQLREMMFSDTPFQWFEWVFSLSASIFTCFIGYWWFQKSRPGFADVL
jgi:lipopolysaccharide transport system permease protein